MKDIELWNGDCLELFSKIENNSINSVICDIPYGTTACSWDSIIDFDIMWKELHRITTEEAPIVLFSSQPFTSALIMSNIKEFREEIIWQKNKSASGLQATQKHIKIHENIIVFAKKGVYTYNPQKWVIDDKFVTKRKTLDNGLVHNNIYGDIERTRKLDDGTRNPESIVSCSVPFTPHNNTEYDVLIDVRVHPTQKPERLMSYLVKTYSNENDRVLDFTMGSGTTGLACRRANRKFLGIEKEKKYYNIALKRFDESKVDDFFRMDI